MTDLSVAIPFSDPITVADLDRICLLPHDGSRNWFVTMAYWDLSRVMTAYTHALDVLPVPGDEAGVGQAYEATQRAGFAAEQNRLLGGLQRGDPIDLAHLVPRLRPAVANDLTPLYRAAARFEPTQFCVPPSRRGADQGVDLGPSRRVTRPSTVDDIAGAQ